MRWEHNLVGEPYKWFSDLIVDGRIAGKVFKNGKEKHIGLLVYDRNGEAVEGGTWTDQKAAKGIVETRVRVHWGIGVVTNGHWVPPNEPLDDEHRYMVDGQVAGTVAEDFNAPGAVWFVFDRDGQEHEYGTLRLGLTRRSAPDAIEAAKGLVEQRVRLNWGPKRDEDGNGDSQSDGPYREKQPEPEVVQKMRAALGAPNETITMSPDMVEAFREWAGGEYTSFEGHGIWQDSGMPPGTVEPGSNGWNLDAGVLGEVRKPWPS